MAVETCPKCKADVSSRYCPQCGQKMHKWDWDDLLAWVVRNRERNQKSDVPNVETVAMWTEFERLVRSKMEPPI